jgi:hypothetical protein
MDDGNVLDCLLDTLVRQERAPALGIFGPRVTRPQDATPGLLAIIGVIEVADGEVGDGAASVDALVLLSEAATRLEEDFC